MAVVLLSATGITNANSGLFNNANYFRGMLREAVDNMEITNGDSIGSIYRMCRVPSNAGISRVLLSCDAIATAIADVGIYQTVNNGGAVVKVDFFGSAVSLTAALVHSDITHEADPADAGTQFGLQDTRKMLWEALAFTTDPKVDFDVAATLTAAATASGTLGLRVQYKV